MLQVVYIMFIAMDFMGFSVQESLSFQSRKVISGFILGVGVSLIILFIFIELLLNDSFEVSEVQVFHRGFARVVTNSSFSHAEEIIARSSFPGKANTEEKKTIQKTWNLDTDMSPENIKVGHSSNNEKMKSDYYEKCDIYDGKWVRDYSKPYYPIGSCPHVDPKFDCSRNGRPDEDYVHWRWQPNGCNIPSLNATDFLERLRGQRLVFVGDSLNRQMWASLVCILRHSIKDKKRVLRVSAEKRGFEKRRLTSYRFEDYNCTVKFVVSQFLVQKSTYKAKNGSSRRTVRLDLIEKKIDAYRDADIIVFNSGHWWIDMKTAGGENFFEEGNHVYPNLDLLEAYKKGLNTWASWINTSIDANRTLVFFRGYSVEHYGGGLWNSGGQCHRETEPIFNDTQLQEYPSKMRVVESVISKIKIPVIFMNISKLTNYRKDGHPSIYTMEHKTEEERKSAVKIQDCNHWCMPGVPDTWNELLYVSLLRYGKEPWKN